MEPFPRPTGTTATIVRRFVDLDRLRRRLGDLPNLAALLPEALLVQDSEKWPHVHPMAWRLGAWESDGRLSALDELVGWAAEHGCWDQEELGHQIRDREFGTFWSLLWELQVARFFADRGSGVRKVEGGTARPDLQVVTCGRSSFVECFVPRGSFAFQEFLTELCTRVEPRLRVRQSSPAKARPQAQDAWTLARVLELLAANAMSPSDRSTRELPLQLAELVPGFEFRVEGGGDREGTSIPTKVRASPCPEALLRHHLESAGTAKADRNGLEGHRPNLLAVNLLSELQQYSSHLVHPDDLSELLPPLPESIDAIAFASCGIDELAPRTLVGVFRGAGHPLQELTRSRPLVGDESGRSERRNA